MEPAVLAGDFIIASKLIPGPRVFKNLRQIRVDGKVQTKRFNGIRKVRRNDILVFNFPYSAGWDRIDMNLNVYYLKRCVALPGDTFSIETGELKIENYTDSLGCVFRQRELSQMSQEDFPPDVWRSFPYDTVHYRWNIKDFGPLYVPAANATIAVDTLNIRLYERLIEYETDKRAFVRDGSVYLGDEEIKAYTFRLNYYFMAGDQVLDSQDSRYWGLLPEDHIIGKAVIIVKSIDPQTGKFRWERFLKAVK
jgi:signal peptidase I